MTDERFSELVNLYLDKEISTSDLALLKAELAKNSGRKTEFQQRCRLHQAMRLALGAPSSGVSRSRSKRRRSSDSTTAARAKRTSGRVRSQQSSSSRSNGGHRFPEAASEVSHFSRWFLGAGLAACITVGGLVLLPVFNDTANLAKQTLQGVEEDELQDAVDPLDSVGRSELKRFASAHQRDVRSASLAAELRLLGLRPEVMAAEASLSEVSLASFQPRDVRHRQIEMLNQLQEYTPIPEAEILQAHQPQRTRATTWADWVPYLPR